VGHGREGFLGLDEVRDAVLTVVRHGEGEEIECREERVDV
jgi:hypothetical protein